MTDSTHTITELKPSAKRPDAVIVKVDGKAAVTVSMRHAADLGLGEGVLWTEQLAAEVERAALIDKAIRAAMNRLAKRPSSRRDMDAKLNKLGYESDVRAATLDYLENLNYIDDVAYAKALVEEMLRLKPAGPRLLKQKLWQKGISGKLAETAVAEAIQRAEQDDTTTSQRDHARTVAEKKLRTLGRYDEATKKRRVYSLLARRGFDHEVIDSVMSKLDFSADQETR